jgi:hypothetical protein
MPRGEARKRAREKESRRRFRRERAKGQMNYYSAAETEFLRAIECFRRENGRLPSLVEAFRIARRLGWEKPL